jgi:hypothetical protein
VYQLWSLSKTSMSLPKDPVRCCCTHCWTWCIDRTYSMWWVHLASTCFSRYYYNMMSNEPFLINFLTSSYIFVSLPQVVGISHRIDITSLLEKRVISRLSAQCVYLRPKSAQEVEQV